MSQLFLDEISLDELNEEMDELNLEADEELLQQALSKGVDLREYARDIEEELKAVEMASIEDYIKEDDNLKTLHNDIGACKGILERMENMLGGFQTDLSQISGEISQLQSVSMTLNIKLTNRKALQSQLSAFVDQMVIPPSLALAIDEAPVDEAYMEHLKNLRVKLSFFDAGLNTESKAYQEMSLEVEHLRLQATLRTREFLLSNINLLKKPQTNIQIIQRDVLLKFKYLLEFLLEVNTETFEEVKQAYVSTMDRLYSSKLKLYCAELLKNCADIGDGAGGVALMAGVEEKGKRKKLSKRYDASKTVFSIDGRVGVLEDLEQDKPPITVQECKVSKAPYAFELIWRSTNSLFADMASSEFLFCEDFFGRRRSHPIFDAVFVSAKAFLRDTLQKELSGSNDGVAMLLLVAINYNLQIQMGRKRISALDNYFDLINITVWPFFKSVFDKHVQSLKSVDVRALVKDQSINVHTVAERYREFVVSCLQVKLSEMSEQMIAQSMSTLRQAVMNFLEKTAMMCFKVRPRQICFMVVNLDAVLGKFKEVGLESDEIAFFEENLETATSDFVESELGEHFVNLVKFFEDGGAGVAGAEPDPALVEALIKEFGATWQSSMQRINKDVASYYCNVGAELRTDVLKRVFTQLMLYYTRFDDLVKKSGLQGKYRKELVSTRDIMFEIKKYSG